MLIVLVMLLAQTSPDSESVCAWMRQLGGPQPVYVEMNEKVPLQIAEAKPRVVPKSKRRPAGEGNYFFSVDSEAENVVLRVHTGGATDLRVTVPELAHRPITARWVNAKVLYIEVFRSPHSGVYWLLDVERREILASEGIHDGQLAWAACTAAKR